MVKCCDSKSNKGVYAIAIVVFRGSVEYCDARLLV